MVRCPVCESVQIGFLVSPRPTSCYYCGATWLQDGSEQSVVHSRRDEGPARVDRAGGAKRARRRDGMGKQFSLKPLEDRIVVKPSEGEETTASGIVIPDTAKERPQEGEVMAVGPGPVRGRAAHPHGREGRGQGHLLQVRRHRGQG